MKSLALVFWKEAIHDLLKAQNIPLAYRFWAIIHGFNPVSAWFKKINSHNYRNYLTDYVYYSHAPYNNDVTATRLISKLKFRDTFISFGAYLPKYYAKINNGVVEYLDSWCDDIPREGLVAILELLKRENTLVLKRLSGRAGLGFMLLRHLDNDLYNINDDILSEAEVLKNFLVLKII